MPVSFLPPNYVSNMSSHNDQERPWPIRLIGIRNDSHGLHFIPESLSKIQEFYKGSGSSGEVAIIGVIGQPQSGKSLTTNYILEYLENFHTKPYEWFQTCGTDLDRPDSSSEGRQSRENFERLFVKNHSFSQQQQLSGIQDKTLDPGIYVWPIQTQQQKESQQEEQQKERELCILVMDIVFNPRVNSQQDYTKLVDFCIQSSSIVVVCDSMKHWNNISNSSFWTLSKSSIATLSGPKLLQNCHYLLRDWKNKHEFIFGSKGGGKFFNKFSNPESKSQLNENLDKHIKEIAKYLSPLFQNFDFHLFPYSTAEHRRIMSDCSAFRNYFSKFVTKELDRYELRPVIREKSKLSFAHLHHFLEKLAHDIDAEIDSKWPKIDNSNILLPILDKDEMEDLNEDRKTTSSNVKQLGSSKEMSKETVVKEETVKSEASIESRIMKEVSTNSAVEGMGSVEVKNSCTLSSSEGTTKEESKTGSEPKRKISRDNEETKEKISTKPKGVAKNEETTRDLPEKFQTLSIQHQPSTQSSTTTTPTPTLACLQQGRSSQQEQIEKMYSKEIEKLIENLRSDPFYYYQNLRENHFQVSQKVKIEFPDFFTNLDNLNQAQVVEQWMIVEFAQVEQLSKNNKNRENDMKIEVDATAQSVLKKLVSDLRQKMTMNSQHQIFSPLDNLLPHQVNNPYFAAPLTEKHGHLYSKCSKISKYSQIQAENIYRTLNHCIFILNSYIQKMRPKLTKAIYFETVKEFEDAHSSIVNTLPSVQSQGSYYDTEKEKKIDWVLLQDFVRFGLLNLKKRYEDLNNRIKSDEDEISKVAQDLAITKYEEFMTTSTGSKIFSTREIRDFHQSAYKRINDAFHNLTNFSYTRPWRIAWEKVNGALEKRSQIYFQENNRRIQKCQLARKNAESAGEVHYKQHMMGCMKGGEKCITQVKLKQEHTRAEKEAYNLFHSKMKSAGLENLDVSKSLDSIKSKIEKMRVDFLAENEEKLKTEKKEAARAAEEKIKRLEKEEEDRKAAAVAKNIKKVQQQQYCEHKGGSSSNSGPTPSNNSFKYGVGIHFNRHRVQVGVYTQHGFEMVHENLVPTITFTPSDIIIGDDDEPDPLKTNDPLCCYFNLFELLDSNEGGEPYINIGGRGDNYKVEEILGIYFRKIKCMIETSLNVNCDSEPFCVVALHAYEPLNVKRMVKTGLILAGFSQSLLIHITTAMGISCRYRNGDLFSYKNALSGTLSGMKSLAFIHHSPQNFEIAVGQVSASEISMKGLTGLTGPSRDDIPKSSSLFKGLYKGVKSFFYDFVYAGEETKEMSEMEKKLTSLAKEAKMKSIEMVIAVSADSQDQLSGEGVHFHGASVQTMDECQGIAWGAAFLAASKVGVLQIPTINYNQVHPYDLKVSCRKDNGREVKNQCLWSLNDRQNKLNQDIWFPSSVSEIVLREGAGHKYWIYGTFQIPIPVRCSTASHYGGSWLEASSTEDGIVTIKVKGKKKADEQLISNNYWMSGREREEAKEKLKNIFKLSDLFPVIGPQQPPLLPTSPPPQTEDQQSAGKSVGTQVGHMLMVTANVEDRVTNGTEMKKPEVNPKQTDSGPGRDDTQGKKELEMSVNEVEEKLGKSQNTNGMIRDRILELIKEIRKSLVDKEMDTFTVENYKQRLAVVAGKMKE